MGRRPNIPPQIADAKGRKRDTWTRKQVAATLGVTYSAVRELEARGELATKCINGVYYFDPEQVRHYKDEHRITPIRSPEGELAARAYELFEEGTSERHCVIKLRQHPRVVRELFRTYAEGEGLLLPGPVAQALRTALNRPDLKAEELPAIVTRLRDAARAVNARRTTTRAMIEVVEDGELGELELAGDGAGDDVVTSPG